MFRTLSGLAVAVALLLPAQTLAAQDSDRWVPTGWEISPFLGAFDDRPEFDPTGSSAIYVDPAKNLYAGGHLGYNFGSGLFVEAEGGYFPWVMRTGAGNTDLKLMLYSAGLGFNLPVSSSLGLFAAGGIGQARWDADGYPSETDLQFNYGGGARISLTDWLGLRAEARMHQVPDALGNTSAALAGAAVPNETLWGWGFSLGASVFLGGGPRDSDGDGVRDDLDACPDTPMGARVDASGCPLDSDRDGVADYMDRCPNTPAGARVDATGCPTDADRDGVFDGIDRCPNTPAGATVDSTGCPMDSDRDGVFDGIDRCANTPAGATVDSTGCPMDSDRDGVWDGIDRCPNTAAGSQVDATGCPTSQIERDIESGSFTFDAVNFAFDSAVLRPAATPILNEVGRVLSARPNRSVRLTGHTDSIGTEEYNRRLSLRRAESVRDYLLSNFSALDRSKFEVVGAGESQPVADNGTDAGRQQNRRVEFVIQTGR